SLFVGSALRIASGHPNSRVWHEQRDRVIQPRISVGAGRRERVRYGIVEIGIQTGGGGIFVVVGAAQSQNFAGGKHDRVHLDARLRHRRAKHPGGRRGGEVDGFRRRGGRISAAHNNHVRGIVV